MNSYNDFSYSFSPFIDSEFLINFAHTKFFGSRYSFHSNNIRLKRQSTLLYHRIVNSNYSPLTKYRSSRGYSMHDATGIKGNIKILIKKFVKNNNKHKDWYNTHSTDLIFLDMLNNLNSSNKTCFLNHTMIDNTYVTDINSLHYWMNLINERYQ